MLDVDANVSDIPMDHGNDTRNNSKQENCKNTWGPPLPQPACQHISPFPSGRRSLIFAQFSAFKAWRALHFGFVTDNIFARLFFDINHLCFADPGSHHAKTIYLKIYFCHQTVWNDNTPSAAPYGRLGKKNLTNFSGIVRAPNMIYIQVAYFANKYNIQP